MGVVPENKRLKILLVLSVCVMTALVFVMTYSFNTDDEEVTEKVGFIILGNVREVGWNASNFNGMKAACEHYDIELLLRENVEENTGQCRDAIKELINEGATMIFLASFSYSAEAKDLIESYPNIGFASNAGTTYPKNLTAYFVRMYQGRYLSGVLAGMKTKSNVLGYVAAMPNSEVNRGISAFTLGAQSVNPNVKVVVMWTGSWQDEEIEKVHAERLIKEAGADVLTYHQDEAATADVADSLGVDFIAYNAVLEGYSDHYLASLNCRWDLFYKDVVQRYLKGELNSIQNHWIGVSQGAVNLSNYSKAVTPQMLETVENVHRQLNEDKFIFSGEIYDNQGNKRCAEGEVISDDVLLTKMDWLVRGVEVLD